MRVVDCHRVIGAVPMARAPEDPLGLLAELDQLGIDTAAVTPAWQLYGDPRGTEEYVAARGEWAHHSRLIEVPVVLPGPADTRFPADLDDLDVGLVRTCPARHRFDPLGPAAVHWWNRLAERGTALAVDAGELGLDGVARLAQAAPALDLLVLGPGYRELRRLRELLDAHPRIHVETGTIVSAGGVEWLARGVGAHRLVFGTGAPLWDDAGPRFQLDHLGLPADDVALIAHGSWDRLVKVDA